MALDSVEGIDDLVNTADIAKIEDLGTVKIDDRKDASQIRKTIEVARSEITPSIPHPSDRSLKGRGTKGGVPLAVQPLVGSKRKELQSLDALVASEPSKKRKTDETTQLNAQNNHLAALESELIWQEDALKEAEEALTGPNPPKPHRLVFPNLAWEAVKAGLGKEKITNDQLNGHIKDAQKHQKDIDLLLDLSAELTAIKEDQKEEKVPLPEKVKTLVQDLKERGIDLWKHEDMTMSKEKISDLKSLSSAQVDKIRSNLQILFTTKIQTLVTAIGAILECVKDMIRNNTKLINAANRLPGH